MKSKKSTKPTKNTKSKPSKSKKEDLIQGHMNIQDAVARYPAAANVFALYGLQCIGCHVSSFESIEQGAMSHGMKPATFKMMMRDANKIIKENSSGKSVGESEVGEPLQITMAAADKFAHLIKQTKKEGQYLRIEIKSGGCSGKTYSFTIEEKKRTPDKVIGKGKVTFIISPDTFNQLKGSTIDYVESLQGSGFKVNNPNAKKSCGCGSSFS